MGFAVSRRASRRFADGTAAAPSIGFTSDLDTGFFRAAANSLGVTVAGSEVGRWTADGLGIKRTPAYRVDAAFEDAGTNNVQVIARLSRRSTGTPTASYGGELRFSLKSSTTQDRTAGAISWSWATATDATRKGRVTITASDSVAAREGVRVETNGSAATLGFYGASAVAQQTVTGSRGANAALASVLTALATLGLIVDGSS